MGNAKSARTVEIAAVIIFFSLFGLSLLQPISDPDLFWHLKTGEWIWQNKKLPEADMFSFTASSFQDKTSVKTAFILRQYWLAQLVMYGFYSLGGFYGIEAFRCLVYLGIGLVLYRWMRKNRISRLASLIFLIPVAWFSAFWVGERPNIISFLLTVIVVYLLEDLKDAYSEQHMAYRKEQNIRCLLLPLIMLVWPSIHAGFIIGDTIIVIYILSEISSLIYKKIMVKKAFAGSESSPVPAMPIAKHSVMFIVVCVISVFLTAHKIIPMFLRIGEAYSFYGIMSEMMSPFAHAKFGKYQYISIITAMLLPLLLGIRMLRFRHAFIIIYLAFISLNSIRFIPFLVFIATMNISVIWGRYIDKRIDTQRNTYILHIIVIIFIFIAVLGKIKTTILNRPLIDPFYSKVSVEFIKKEKPEKELFNYYGSGGYLIWELYPEYRVFIDGRTVLYDVFLNSYYMVLSGSKTEIGSMPAWKAILNAYRVNTVLIPVLNVRGDLGFIRLVRRLIEDDEWSLVFASGAEVIFVRNTEKNREIIKKYAMPKLIAYERALRLAEDLRKEFPGYYLIYLSQGEINLYLGRPKVAVSNFEAAFKLNTSLKGTILSDLVEEIKTGRDYSRLMDQAF